jgi:hypothetical protein
MNTQTPEMPNWFRNRVLDGLQFMLALGLPGTPSSEIAKLTAQSWMTALWMAGLAWNEERDAYRLYQGFINAAAAADRWPTPRAVLQALPARPEQPQLPAPLAARCTPEQRARMAEARRRVTDAVTTMPTVKAARAAAEAEAAVATATTGGAAS